MQFTTVFIAAMATLAAAVPTTGSGEPTSKGLQQQCKNNQKVSCCNGGGKKLLGAQCVQIPILNLIPISQQCQNDNVVACCNTKQTGLINVNVECIPVNLDLV